MRLIDSLAWSPQGNSGSTIDPYLSDDPYLESTIQPPRTRLFITINRGCDCPLRPSQKA